MAIPERNWHFPIWIGEERRPWGRQIFWLPGQYDSRHESRHGRPHRYAVQSDGQCREARLELNRVRLNWAGQEAFNRAVERANSFTSKPNSDELLKLYGLYKQGTTGDVNTGRADDAPAPGR